MHDDGLLRCAGKVATGFTDKMRRISGDAGSPSSRRVPLHTLPKGLGAALVKPVLVAEVDFTEGHPKDACAIRPSRGCARQGGR